MKKILICMFLLVFELCLVGCETTIEYSTLSEITKSEEFNNAYVSSVNGDSKVLLVDFDVLKEKEFYKNIMNSNAQPTDVLPEADPLWSLVIKSNSNQLIIDNLGNLYAKFNDECYHILCLENDFALLNEFLISTDVNLNIEDLFDTLVFGEVTLAKGDLSLKWIKSFNELKNQSIYNDLMKVEVYKSISTLEKMTMVDADYYLNFYIKDSEDFFSIRIYGANNEDYDYIYCTTKSNVISGLYEFTMTKELFNKIYDYFIEINKFEEIIDIELLAFYNETMVINSVEGFPSIVTTDDKGTSKSLASVHKRYNEEFFEDYALMIVAFNICTSEKIIGIDSIKFDGKKFIIAFDVNRFPVTDDIFFIRYYVVKIDKSSFGNLDRPSYQVDMEVTNKGTGSSYDDGYVEFPCEMQIEELTNIFKMNLKH